MSKAANPGELRTPVFFIKTVLEKDEEADVAERKVNVFGEDISVLVKWVNAHGTESYTAMQMQLREPATITCRYSPLINERLTVYKGSDPYPYEIISIDNVEERGAWLEIKVQRKAAAK